MTDHDHDDLAPADPNGTLALFLLALLVLLLLVAIYAIAQAV